MQYSQYYNRKTNTVGHLWQGRYYSCALDEPHVHAAVRYVEMNPVRTGIVASAEDYPWSSAKSHVTGIADPVLAGRCFLVETIRDWKQYLAERRRIRQRGRNSSSQRRLVVPAEKMISSRGWRRFSAGDLLPFLRAVPTPGKTRRRQISSRKE